MIKGRNKAFEKHLAIVVFVSLLTLLPVIGYAEIRKWNEAESPYILVYTGKGVAEGGPEAISNIAVEQKFTVAAISDLRHLPEALGKAWAFVIGGTDDDTSMIAKDLSKVESALKSYIRNGGRYLGICGGAYLASLGTDWPDSEGGREEGLGLVPIDSFPFDDEYTGPQLITVNWPKGTKRAMYYQYGPAFDSSKIAALRGDADVIAYYSTGSVAAFSYNSGKGRIVLCGPHPEGVEDWLEDDDGSMIRNYELWDEKGTSDLAKELLVKLLKR